MRLKDIILCGCLGLVGLSSCSDDETTNGKTSTQMGILSLGVETNAKVNVIVPNIDSRADSGDPTINAFPVVIYNSKDSIVKSYPSYAEMDAEVTLPVGDYKVIAHSPGDLKTEMSAPYFKGEESLTIRKDITTNAKVTCKMQNMPIKMNYDGEFTNKFSSWTITLDDGQNHVLTFESSKENPNYNPEVVYWAIGKDVKTITVNVIAITDEGSTIKETYRCTKSAANEDYVGDSESFGAGDGITISFTPKAENVQPGAGIDISIDLDWVTTDESDDNVIVDVEIETGETGGDGPVVTPPSDEDDNNNGDEEKLKITMPDDITYKRYSEAPSADVIISSPNKLKSVIVKIIPGNKGFEEALRELEPEYGISLLSGAELVDNDEINGLFSELGTSITSPSSSSSYKEAEGGYKFPVGDFFNLMSILGVTEAGTPHQFVITVKDSSGQTGEGTLKVTIVD